VSKKTRRSVKLLILWRSRQNWLSRVTTVPWLHKQHYLHSLAVKANSLQSQTFWSSPAAPTVVFSSPTQSNARASGALSLRDGLHLLT
jgi:hypothetical protein